MRRIGIALFLRRNTTMRRIGIALFLCTIAVLPAAAKEKYLYVWAGDQTRKGPDFLAVVNFDERSPKYGSIVGKVEEDGTLRRAGSIIGRIESAGTIRRDGSIWGSASKCCGSYGGTRQLAAVLYFFSAFFAEE